MKKRYMLICSLFLIGITIGKAQYTDLVDFTGTNGLYTGANPFGSLTLSGNTFFGMTNEGGAYNDGVIFMVSPNGSNYTDLVDFTGTGGSYPGRHPAGSLILSGSTLYGMTYNGGANSYGNIFSVSTNGSNYKDLLDFTGMSGSYPGENPYGTLILEGSTLFGMTEQGGTKDSGVIFSVSTNGSDYTDLVDFTGTEGLYRGAFPTGSLILSGSTLFGMTQSGGANNDGVIFSVSTNGSNYTKLVDFTGTSGSYRGENPEGSLILLGSTLFGMTFEGGVNNNSNGVIFSVSTNGSKYTDLVNFTGTNGAHPGEDPNGSLLLSGTTLLGMTLGGGANDNGDIFSVSTNGTNYTDLVDFTGGSGSNMGKYPYNDLILSSRTLYGMTSEGGANGYGNIFSLTDNSLGINELANNSGRINVYPNPSNGIFTISLSHSELVSESQNTIEIYNVLGERIYKATLKQVQGDEQIKLSTQPNGVYFYRVLSDDKGEIAGQGKLIIEK